MTTSILIYSIFYWVNAVAFLFYAVDKLWATLNYRRISEMTLFAISICGGALGALIAMFVFKHKTSKRQFWLVNIICLIIHIIILWLIR